MKVVLSESLRFEGNMAKWPIIMTCFCYIFATICIIENAVLVIYNRYNPTNMFIYPSFTERVFTWGFFLHGSKAMEMDGISVYDKKGNTALRIPFNVYVFWCLFFYIQCSQLCWDLYKLKNNSREKNIILSLSLPCLVLA